jgi:hypothetical protein
MNKQNKERLYKILLEHDRLLHPSVPDHGRAIVIAPDVNEKGIKANIAAFCKAMKFKLDITDSAAKKSVKIERIPQATGRTMQKATVFYKKSDFDKGHHDIQISKNNRLWCIEIKAQNKKTKYKDRQSEVQKQYEKKMNEDFGNSYYIIRGMDDFFSLYDEIILKELLFV